MNKIIFGYEQYNQETSEGWNLNGRIKTCSTKIDFVPINPWLDQIYKVIIDPKSFPDSYLFHPPLMGKVGPEHINKCVHEINEDQVYFYPILIINIGLYIKYINEIEISDKVKNDVLTGKAYIIFIYDNEGDLAYPYCYDTFCNLISKLGLPKDRIIMFHGDFNTETYETANFIYKPVCQFAYWLNRNYNHLVDYRPDKIFLNYNRTLRPQKQLMLCSLIKHNLLQHGIYSCGKLLPIDSVLKHFDYHLDEADINILKQIEMTSPDNNIDNNQIQNDTSNIVTENYRNSFLSLVTETLTNSIFISEKTFKPILAGHPFIILAGKNHLQKLKEFGYKTFSDYWNEDYDLDSDVVTKVEKIAKIIDDLNKLSVEQLIHMRNSMIPILKHNQEVFTNSIEKNNYYGASVLVKNELLKLINSK